MTGSATKTLKSEMLAAFPEAIPKIVGSPNLREMIRLMQHLMVCSQTHATEASPLGFLFVCLPQALWATYSQDAYPTDPQNPGPIPTMSEEMSDAQWQNHKTSWEYFKKIHNDFNTMNSALTDRFVSLIEPAYTKDYTTSRLRNPNQQFREAFAYFVGKYGATNEGERADNKDRMKAAWTLQDGWERLEQQIEDSQLFALFAHHAITDHELVDTAIGVIGQTGLFANQYEQWHESPDDQKTWNHFKSFWKAKIKLKADTSLNASQFGYGGSANEHPQTDADAEYTNSVANFANAHNNTQNTLNNLSTSNAQLNGVIPQIQQQMNYMQMQMAQMANAQQWQGNPNNNNQNKNNNNNYRNNNNNRNRNNNNRNRNTNANNGTWTGYNNNRNTGGNTRNNMPDRPSHVKLYNNNGYCWTHGHDQPSDHTSQTCKYRHPNHCATATKNNTQGGNPKFVERTQWPNAAGYPEYVLQRRQQGNQQANHQWNGNNNPNPQPQFGGNTMQMPTYQFGPQNGQQQMQGQQSFPTMPQQQFGGFTQQQAGQPPGYYPMGNMGGQRFF